MADAEKKRTFRKFTYVSKGRPLGRLLPVVWRPAHAHTDTPCPAWLLQRGVDLDQLLVGDWGGGVAEWLEPIGVSGATAVGVGTAGSCSQQAVCTGRPAHALPSPRDSRLLGRESACAWPQATSSGVCPLPTPRALRT